jgi:hypothetical protein
MSHALGSARGLLVYNKNVGVSSNSRVESSRTGELLVATRYYRLIQRRKLAYYAAIVTHSFSSSVLHSLMLDKARLDPQDQWITSVIVFLNNCLPSPECTGLCCEFCVQLKASSKIAKAKFSH